MREFSKLALAGALAVFSLGSAAPPAAAGLLGVDFIAPPIFSSCTVGAGSQIGCSQTGTLGYKFTVGNDPITVSGLAVFDFGDLGSVIGSTIGLWDSGGTLVTPPVTVTTPTAAGIGGLWAVQSIPEITLAANTTYYVGAEGPIDPNSGWGILPFFAGDIPVFEEGVNFVSDQYDLSQGLTFPGTSFGFGADHAGFFGANIEVVPEPMSLSLFGMGLAGFGLLRRRKKA